MEIGTSVNGRNLDDPSLELIWTRAEELSAFILVHPLNAAGGARPQRLLSEELDRQPFDTTVAAASLVFGGVLERHLALTFCMVHGGGFTPYQAARWTHGWEVRKEPKVNLKEPPQASIARLFYDTVLHDRRPLQFLVDLVGPGRILWAATTPSTWVNMTPTSCVRSKSHLAIKRTFFAGTRRVLSVNRQPASSRLVLDKQAA